MKKNKNLTGTVEEYLKDSSKRSSIKLIDTSVRNSVWEGVWSLVWDYVLWSLNYSFRNSVWVILKEVTNEKKSKLNSSS